MFTRQLIHQSLALAFTLTAASAAFAEQPTRQGYRSSIVASSCSIAPVAQGSGYRDSFARSRSSAGTAVAGRVSSYRDAFARVPAEKSNVQVASSDARVCSN